MKKVIIILIAVIIISGCATGDALRYYNQMLSTDQVKIVRCEKIDVLIGATRYKYVVESPNCVYKYWFIAWHDEFKDGQVIEFTEEMKDVARILYK